MVIVRLYFRGSGSREEFVPHSKHNIEMVLDAILRNNCGGSRTITDSSNNRKLRQLEMLRAQAII